MSSPAKRLAAGAATLIVLLAAFLILRPGDEQQAPDAAAVPVAASGPVGTTPATAPEQATTPKAVASAPKFVELRSGAVRKIKVSEGDTIRLAVKSAGAEELHVHGYDLSRELPAGKTVRLTFKATITGIFEVEFEQSAEQIAEITVEP